MIVILYIAALIFSLAFAALVIFIIVSLNPILKEVDDTLSVMKEEVNNITVESTELLKKTNRLADDIENKSAKLNGLFDGIKGIGETVKDLNTSIKQVSTKVSTTLTKEQDKIAQFTKWGTALLNLRRRNK